MCTPASAEFKSLRYLRLDNLPCCTHLPDGLRCLPNLELLVIIDAPAVKRIGPEFQASLAPSASAAHPPFPKLRVLLLVGLCEWEEWDWNNDDGCEDEQWDVKAVIAMPFLEKLYILLSVKTHRRVATGNTKSREVAGVLASTASSDNGPQSGTHRRFRRM